MSWYDSMNFQEKFWTLFWNILVNTGRSVQSVTNVEIEELYWNKYQTL
jgi:hypothetical protein